MICGICIVLVQTGLALQGQLVLNEVSSANATVLLDEDGDGGDWIELYNPGNAALDLGSYSLSDELSVPAKWRFPDYRLEAGKYLVVFATGKDRSDPPQWWHTPVRPGDQWAYLLPDAGTPESWREAGYDDSGWPRGPGGFGYGDGDDATQVGATAAIFLRRTFTLEHADSVLKCLLHMDYDDGFVAYLNGVEIARSRVSGTFPSYNALSSSDHEALMYSGGSPEAFEVEVTPGLFREGENILAIQVHNVSNSSSDLSAIPFLSLLLPQPPTQDPVELLQLSSGSFHSNFKLNADGESLYLFQNAVSLVDSIRIPPLGTDHSYGRHPVNSDQWGLFGDPSPWEVNNSEFFTAYVETQPRFSTAPGYFASPFQLSLESEVPGDSIYYSLDGSVPGPHSLRYREPLMISDEVMVRARIIRSGMLPGAVVSNVYYSGTKKTLSVVTVSTDPDDLWDHYSGIYAPGPYASPDFPHFNANFWNDWERPAHIGILDENGNRVVDAQCGIKIFGGWTRGHPQKSLAVYARAQYGTGKISYRLFENKDNDEFEGFVLRNSGNDWFGVHNGSGTMIRDQLMTRLTRGMDIEHQASRQAVVFLNGEYWGIHNIREKINEHFLDYYQGEGSTEIELLEGNQSAIQGDASHYSNMMGFVKTHNFSDEENYTYLGTKMDIPNFINYQVAQIYYFNGDWPGNNIKYWRPATPEGKWRWILYDTDFGFGLWDKGKVYANSLAFATEVDGPGHPNPPWSTLLLRKLLENQGFERQFINAFADRINTNFRSDSVSALVDELSSAIDAEMHLHSERWGESHDGWVNQIRALKDFGRIRPVIMQNHLINFFGLVDRHDLSLDISGTEQGLIRLNTISVTSFPWLGTYFQGNPIRLTAVSRPGYRFTGWSGSYNSAEPEIELDLVDATTLTANFEYDPDGSGNALMISEISYTQDPDSNSGDWVELYNNSDQYLDISGWTFKDSDDSHAYRFTAGTFLAPGAHHVLCRDLAAFQSIYPSIPGFEGPLGFGFSSSGENLRLYNERGELADSVNYTAAYPWPVVPSGSGATLELISPDLDNAQASSWRVSQSEMGTPGSSDFRTHVGNEAVAGLPGDVLFQNAPNPFTGSTRILFRLASSKPVSLAVYDLNGRLVERLSERFMEAGYHEVEWAGGDEGQGIYILRMVTPEASHTIKMLMAH